MAGSLSRVRSVRITFRRDRITKVLEATAMVSDPVEAEVDLEEEVAAVAECPMATPEVDATGTPMEVTEADVVMVATATETVVEVETEVTEVGHQEDRCVDEEECLVDSEAVPVATYRLRHLPRREG